MSLEKTWRWFGKNDKIQLSDIRQIGIEGIVTALHHIQNGEIWSVEEINQVKIEIEQQGMRWSVVESLPVHEEIKYGGPNRDRLIENYKQSLVNLSKCGLDTICYNFMPVIDWIRTDLHYKLENGAEALFFDFVEFVVFDRYILGRQEAVKEYPEEIIEKAARRNIEMTTKDKARLINTIIVETQGFIDGISVDNPVQAVKIFKELLKKYKGIGKVQLRQNLKFFLEAIIPDAEKYGIKMCIHPDDPPMKVLGLPRIVSSSDDIKWILGAIDSPANGLTFCSGSLSAGAHNNLNKMVHEFAHKIYFAHLRNTHLLDNGNFYEAEHLQGRADMYTILKALLHEQEKRSGNARIPMRVDHGHRILNDLLENHNPGYPLIGRMKAMAEIRGLELGITRSIK